MRERYLAARGLRLLRDCGVGEIWNGTGREEGDINGYQFYRVASAAPQSGRTGQVEEVDRRQL